jgi:hypothetical protein
MLIEDKVSKIFITQHIFGGDDENTPLKISTPPPIYYHHFATKPAPLHLS